MTVNKCDQKPGRKERKEKLWPILPVCSEVKADEDWKEVTGFGNKDITISSAKVAWVW